MHKRSFVLFGAALVGLVMISPVFAAGDSPTPEASASSTTSSTTATTKPSSSQPPSSPSQPPSSPSQPPSSPSQPPSDPSQPPSEPEATCPSETSEAAAPAEGASETYPAGDAGEVEVERQSATELRVVQATPNSGWEEDVTSPSGPRVRVKFKEVANPDSVTKFAASLDSTGSEIRIKVTTCP